MQKIIDTHMHCGSIDGMEGKVIMDKKSVLCHMDKSKTDFAIMSNGDCAEYNKGEFLSEKTAQVRLNQEMLDEFGDRENIAFAFWIRPHFEKLDNTLKDFIDHNKKRFLMLKLHPHHSHIKLDDERLKDYFSFANDMKMPVAVHTVDEEGSSTTLLAMIAKQYKNTNFIAVHMDMMSDHEKAAKAIAQTENLYGDTTWVSYERFLELKKTMPPHKILFGTDTPVSNTIMNFYKPYYDNAKLHSELFYQNATLAIPNLKNLIK